MIRKSGYFVLVAVALVFVSTTFSADSFAEFEQRAMTRLFVLAALDTLIGSRLGTRLASIARPRPVATGATEPRLHDDRPARATRFRGMRRHREAWPRETFRRCIPAASRYRSGT